MSKTALFVISDAQCGHRHGLLSPETEIKEDVIIKDQPEYYSNRLRGVQKVLWNITKESRKWAGYHLRDYNKWLIHLGETVQGNKYSGDLITDKIWEQIKIASDTIKPFLELKGMVGARICHATDWHDFGMGNAPKIINNELKQKYQKLDIDAVYKTMFDIDGFKMQFQHSGANPSKRKRLEPNAAYWDAHDLILRNRMENEPIPSLVVSAHNHQPSMATPAFVIEGRFVECTWMTTPPLCGPGAYSRNRIHPDYYYVGMSIVRIVDGKLLDIIPFFTKLYDIKKEVICA